MRRLTMDGAEDLRDSTTHTANSLTCEQSMSSGSAPYRYAEDEPAVITIRCGARIIQQRRCMDRAELM
jgi:hypothetical protein